VVGVDEPLRHHAGQQRQVEGADRPRLREHLEAGELAAAGGDHHAAFAGYEAELRGFVTRGQRLATGNAVGLISRSRSQIWMRNQFIRMLTRMPWRGLVAGGVQRAANAITLKDYRS
jgi:hypothetical protein